MTMDILGTKYADKIGYRPLLIFAFSCTVTGLTTMSVLPLILPSVYAGLCISSVIYAIGGGLAEVMISPLIEALPGDEKASAMSILHSFYCWGQAFTIIVTTALVALFGFGGFDSIVQYTLGFIFGIADFFFRFFLANSISNSAANGYTDNQSDDTDDDTQYNVCHGLFLLNIY